MALGLAPSAFVAERIFRPASYLTLWITRVSSRRFETLIHTN
jgi:hypothetical protein